MKKHVHEFSSLWSHFGPFGDQSVHFHPCISDGCSVVKVGPGRNCKRSERHEERDLARKGCP